VSDEWTDAAISNGAVNLAPDKVAVFKKLHRVLKPGDRLQIADIVAHKAVPDAAGTDTDLWTG